MYMQTQVVMDRIVPASSPAASFDSVGEDESSCWRINILVFDIQTWGTKTNFLARHAPAQERYSMLHAVLPCSECMKIQWAGNLHALRQFRDKERDVMLHIMDCFMQLGEGSPCSIGLLTQC